jgi:hypothetical protein
MKKNLSWIYGCGCFEVKLTDVLGHVGDLLIKSTTDQPTTQRLETDSVSTAPHLF